MTSNPTNPTVESEPDIMTQSCADCPSFVKADATQAVIGASVGADACARFGHVLSRPGMPDELQQQIQTEVAGNCAEYGEPLGTPVKIINAQVGIGDPDILQRVQMAPPDPINKPMSCTGCQWFVPPAVVKNELGWTLGMCAARGRLLTSGSYIREASDCNFAVKGESRTSTDGVILLDRYEIKAFGQKITGAARILVSDSYARHLVDPRSYPTDKPVSAAQAANHIRAWRKIDDPEGEKESVYLPIFDGTNLCGYDPRSTYGNHRPDLYVDHQMLLYDLACELMGTDSTPVLIGGAGNGKTELGCYLSYLMDLPFIRISVETGTESWHLKGQGELIVEEKVNPTTGEVTYHQVTKFSMGRFTKWYDKPCVIMVDEPNLKSEVYEFLRPAIDNAKQLVIDDAQGLVVKRGAATFLLCSQNPADDPIYIGTEPMSAADIDRITPIEVSLPPEAIERIIISNHCKDRGYDIPDPLLDKIMKISHDIRELITIGSLPIAWGIRANVKVAQKTRYYSLEKAYRRAITDGFDQAKRDSILGIVRSMDGGVGTQQAVPF